MTKSLLELLDVAPRDRPVAVLLRHAARGPLPAGAGGADVPLTPAGVRASKALGAQLGERLVALHCSPLVRCATTAAALGEGAGRDVEVCHDRLLGDPGAYVYDSRRAGENWRGRTHADVMEHLVTHDTPLVGMVSPRHGAARLARHVVAQADRPGIHAFVTHDVLITTTVSRLSGRPLGRAEWPGFLDGAVLWRERDAIRMHYRDIDHRWTERPRLDPGAVADFARWELARVVGMDCPADFFLAGGAFKSLLTGRAPHDLDLWATSEDDRRALVGTLESRGACRLDRAAFADVFQIGGRIVEVPDAIEPSTLAARLARFDLALSAVGVHHRPRSLGGTLDVQIHPFTHQSVEWREVLLLDPLPHPKYALSTLERVRRYAAELGYSGLQAAAARIWAIFDAADAEEQQRMINRFDRTARGGFGVREEALARRR